MVSLPSCLVVHELSNGKDLVFVLTGIPAAPSGKAFLPQQLPGVWGLPAVAWAERRVRAWSSTAQEGFVPAAPPEELESHWWGAVQ